MDAEIRACLFDLGDTLVERRPEVDEDSIRLIYKTCGSEIPSGRELPKLRRHLKLVECATWNDVAPDKLLQITTIAEEFAFLRDEFYPAVMERFGFAAPPKDLLDVLARRQLGPETFRRFPDVIETLARLKNLEVKIGCVSNALPSAEGILKHLGLWELFDCVVLSYRAECRCLKPSRRIHHEALAGLDVNGEQAIFVDDRPGFANAARPIYKRAVLLDRQRNHLKETGSRIEQLGDLFQELEREHFVAGPHGIPFDQLPLFDWGWLSEIRTQVIGAAVQLLLFIRMLPIVRSVNLVGIRSDLAIR